VEADTWRALRGGVGRLGSLSAERIREELLKVLEADPIPSTALGLYRSAGAMTVLYPELAAWADASEEAWRGALATLDQLPKGRPFLRLAALLRPLERREVEQILMRLRLSNAQVDETARRALAPPLPVPGASDAEFRRWLGSVGPERLAAVARLDLASARAGGPTDTASVVASWRRARAVLATRPPLTVRDLAVDGKDLIAMGLSPGPEFGEILDGLLAWVLEDPVRNEPEALRSEALRLAGAGGRDV
jgi:tRNA nucleotidyltransferase (CCA-adding enzyme)